MASGVNLAFTTEFGAGCMSLIVPSRNLREAGCGEDTPKPRLCSIGNCSSIKPVLEKEPDHLIYVAFKLAIAQ
jgi:hypothetical protein